MTAAGRARLEALLDSARSLADGRSDRGQQARARLIASSGLSPEGVDFALARCLEISPSEAEISALLSSTPRAARAHVLLSANVFVAAHRAIAICLAASEVVFVRASRREPQMAELLLEGAPGLFQLTPELTPSAGDHVWAYGSDETLRALVRALPAGVTLHAHGTGFGIAVLGGEADATLRASIEALAEDIALFDQRGCLSPRVLFALGSETRAHELAQELARALTAVEERIPRGALSPAELAEISAYRDSASYAGELYSAGLGFVSVGEREQLVLPPSGRNLHVVPTSNVLRVLGRAAQFVTSCALAGVGSELRAELAHALPGARSCDFGGMQRPPFDGPVDLRQRAP